VGALPCLHPRVSLGRVPCQEYLSCRAIARGALGRCCLYGGGAGDFSPKHMGLFLGALFFFVPRGWTHLPSLFAFLLAPDLTPHVVFSRCVLFMFVAVRVAGSRGFGSTAVALEVGGGWVGFPPSPPPFFFADERRFWGGVPFVAQEPTPPPPTPTTTHPPPLALWRPVGPLPCTVSCCFLTPAVVVSGWALVKPSCDRWGAWGFVVGLWWRRLPCVNPLSPHRGSARTAGSRMRTVSSLTCTVTRTGA
jgi:hypothetical protein